MAIITVSSNTIGKTDNTPALTLASGDTLNLLAGADIINVASTNGIGMQDGRPSNSCLAGSVSTER